MTHTAASHALRAKVPKMPAVDMLIGDALARAFAQNLERYLHAQRAQLIDVELKLRALHDFCFGCDCSRARCDEARTLGAIKCCPDCSHHRAVRA